LGHLNRGKQILERVIAIYDRGTHKPLIALFGHDVGAGSLAWLSTLEAYAGDLDSAITHAESGIDLAKQVEHPFTLSFAYSMASLSAVTRRDTERARRWSSACLELCAEQSLPFWAGWARGARGYAVAIDEDLDQGLAEMEAGRADLAALGCRNQIPWIGSFIAEALARRGRYEAARKVATECETVAVRQSQLGMIPPSVMAKAMALQGAGRPEAEAEFARAIAVSRDQGQHTLELRAATSLARLWQSQNNNAEARDLLAPVYDWFTEGFDTRDLIEAKALLDTL